MVSPAPALGYYPSYSRMTPNERATYLNWLCNVDDEIDMGYVFVFYYGSERHLTMKDVKNFERAFEMILRLRAHHKKVRKKYYREIFSASQKLSTHCNAIRQIVRVLFKFCSSHRRHDQNLDFTNTP